MQGKGSTLHQVRRWLLLCSAGIVLALVVMAAALLCWLSVQPRNVLPYLPHVQRLAGLEQVRFHAAALTLSFERGFILRAAGVTLVPQDVPHVLPVDELEVEISNHDLLRFRLVPKHVMLKGAEVHITRTGAQNWEVMGVPLKRAAPQTAGSTAAQQPLTQLPDLVQWLETDLQRRPRFLKTVQVENLNITVEDNLRAHYWQLKNVAGRLTKLHDTGHSAVFSGVLANHTRNQQATLSTTLKHVAHSAQVQLELNISDSPVSLFSTYLPAPVQNILHGKGMVLAGVTLGKNNTLQQGRLSVYLTNGQLALETLYAQPFDFDLLNVQAGLDFQGKRRFTLDKIDMRASTGEKVILSGTADMEADIADTRLDITIKTSDLPIERFRRYLPDRKIEAATQWMQEHITAGHVTRAQVGFRGRLRQLLYCGSDCPMSGKLDFKEMSLVLSPNVAPISGLQGESTLSKGTLAFTTKAPASLLNQSIEPLVVEINDIFSKEIPSAVSVSGVLHGTTAEAMGIIERAAQTPPEQQNASTLGGTHETYIHAQVPLTLNPEKTLLEQSFYQAEGRLLNLSVPSSVEGIPGNIRLPEATLSVSPTLISVSGPAEAENMLLQQVRWEGHPLAQNNPQSVYVEGAVSPQMPLVAQQLAQFGVVTQDALPFTLLLHKKEETEQDYLLEASITADKQTLGVPALAWHKPTDEPLVLRINGEVRAAAQQENTTQQGFAWQKINVTGDTADIQVTRQHNGIIEAPVFRLGETDITLHMAAGAVSMTGQRIHAPGLSLFKLLRGGDKTTAPQKNEAFYLNVEQLTFDDAQIGPTTLALRKQARLFEQFELNALYGNGKTLAGSLEPNAGDRTLVLNSTDAGTTLRLLGLYDNAHDGTLRGRMTLFPTQQGYAQSGEGQLELYDFQLRNAPLLARILSLLSLTELLSGQRGISFDKAMIPFRFDGNTITLNDVRLQGSAIALRYNGTINMESGALDLKGSLTPAQSINRLIANIPLIGALLTGSQDGVVVADFSVGGTYANPEISVNPFSVITPGLIKDVFSSILPDNPQPKEDTNDSPKSTIDTVYE